MRWPKSVHRGAPAPAACADVTSVSSRDETQRAAFKQGDWVHVRSLEEILRTLDENSTLDGLPFMPEMAAYCGRTLRLSRLAVKACVECLVGDRRIIFIREFRARDVWVADGTRCTGSGHDGCRRACLLFWKSAWLRRVDAGAGEPVTDAGPVPLTLKTRTAGDGYFCQSTELVRITQPLGPIGRLRVCLEDVRYGNYGVVGMLWAILRPLFWKTLYRCIPRHVVGHAAHTPRAELGLQPGEVVEVRSSGEIAETLNSRGCNRGLRYDRGLNRFCGDRFVVGSRLDHIIIESTGRMIEMPGTVTLAGTTCQCERCAVGGCLRKDPVYWREIWLRRVSGGAQVTDPALRGASVDSEREAGGSDVAREPPPPPVTAPC